MVESAPTDRIGFEPRIRKVAPATMKAISAVKAGTSASWEVASCSGIAIASSVMPARTSPLRFWRVSPTMSWPSPRGATRSETLTRAGECFEPWLMGQP